MAYAIKLNTKIVAIVCIMVALLTVFVIMGFSALKTVVVFTILFGFPLFFILKSLNVEEGNTELFFISLFAGLGAMSFFTFYISRLVPSMKVSAIITWCVLVALGIFLHFFRSKKKTSYADKDGEE